MGMTLREILDLQRRQREETEQSGASGATAATSVAVTEQPTKPNPHTNGEMGGLLARLRGTVDNVVNQTNPVPVGIRSNNRSDGSGSSTELRQGADDKAVENGKITQPSPVFTEAETDTLRKNLAFLAANMEEKEVLGQVLRTTVRQIQQHPELSAIMIDNDYDLIVAAARRTTKYVQRKKEEGTEKRGKKAQEKEELDRWLKDQGIEL